MGGIDKGVTIAKLLARVGRTCLLISGDGSEREVPAVTQPVWRKAKNRFESASGEIGEKANDFCIYIGPSYPDITKLDDDHILRTDGRDYFFVKADRLIVSNNVQYCTGVLKRIYGEDEYAD